MIQSKSIDLRSVWKKTQAFIYVIYAFMSTFHIISSLNFTSGSFNEYHIDFDLFESYEPMKFSTTTY